MTWRATSARPCPKVEDFVGSVERLEWAKANGCLWEEGTCSAVAEYGDLAVLQWARAHGCQWEESTCGLAVYWGHMEVLRWAREHGAPWSAGTRDHAATNGYTDDSPLSI